MASTTISRTINSVIDIRATLNNGSLRRTLDIGTTWNYLRIGARLSFDPTIVDVNSKGKNFFMGVCSGTSNGWNNGSASTTHAVGVLAPSTIYASTHPAPTETSGVKTMVMYGPIAAKRVSTTITESSGIIFTGAHIHANSDYRASMWFVDIEKQTSPTPWNIKLWCINQTPNIVHLTKEQFLNYMIVPYASLNNTDAPWGNSAYVKGTQTLPVNESDGSLNTVNIFCDLPGNLELSDVAVVRFS